MSPAPGTRRVPVQEVCNAQRNPHQDLLAVEEPLEIRLRFEKGGRFSEQSTSITMRTPGNDFELAAGFFLTEGIIRHRQMIKQINHRVGSHRGKRECNVICVELQPGIQFDAERFQRHFYTTSSCGVCGKASLEALRVRDCPRLPQDRLIISEGVVHGLGEKLRAAQSVFDRTGGLHAAALFDTCGQLTSLYEDVGRHNAVDKLIGEQLLADRIPLHDHLMMVSGRTSFEIMQKALVAGIPVVAAVSAPSSLAVDLAREFGMTLLGFVRGDRFNVYTGGQRVRMASSSVA